jgi:hypothetical protein
MGKISKSDGYTKIYGPYSLLYSCISYLKVLVILKIKF